MHELTPHKPGYLVNVLKLGTVPLLIPFLLCNPAALPLKEGFAGDPPVVVAVAVAVVVVVVVGPCCRIVRGMLNHLGPDFPSEVQPDGQQNFEVIYLLNLNCLKLSRFR